MITDYKWPGYLCQYSLNDWGSICGISKRYFSVQTGSGAHVPPYSVGTEGKAAGTWS